MVVTPVLGLFRIQHKGCFVGTDYPGADYTLHIADEKLEQEGCERDSIGYVFKTRIEATIAMREADKAVRAFERELQGSRQAVG
jgi:hypothetical protein